MRLSFTNVDNELASKILESFNSARKSATFTPLDFAKRIYADYSNEINENNFDEIFRIFDLNKLKYSEENFFEEFNMFKDLSLAISVLRNLFKLPINISNMAHFKGLQRMIAPPLEAYKYEGYNKLDVDEKSGISYSKIYE